MHLAFILALLLILITALIIFAASCDNKSVEKWTNLDGTSQIPQTDNCSKGVVDDSSSTLYAGCNGFNCPLDKRKTKRAFYDDGYKMEDDRYHCLCKCDRKCLPTPTNTSSPNSSSNNNSKKPHMGTRIPFPPWFSPIQ